LLLRAVFGLSIVAQGAACLQRADATAGIWFVSLAAIIAGALLLLGLLTPLAGAVIGLGAVSIKLALLPACDPWLFDSGLSLVFGAAILTAIALLGPGAFSLDARLFGRREIIIPPSVESRP
jgi:uncharacterized membrane protein YphA (DoxX/SURF4 family)